LATEQSNAKQFVELRNLGNSVKKMLNRSLNAYARMNVEEALDIIQSDELINEEFDNLTRLLILKMMEDPREIKNALRISWCARALERIGDHSQNICEYIVYLVKGKDVRHTSLDDIRKNILADS
ncbi:MAG: phosphate transport system protein, partial [Polaribacter sp.]